MVSTISSHGGIILMFPGLPKAEYACGYFTEMGIGCRRDPLEANVWYVKAADHGDERAKQRLAIIQAAASGQVPAATTNDKGKLKKGAKDENCAVM
jgi:TPR repeat protein